MKTKKILVTGASGSVGQELLSQLSQNVDYELFVFDLNNSRTRKFYEKFKGKIKFIEGDLGLSSDISKIPENIDVVIHLAAIIPPLADDNPDLAKKVNVHGTQLLVNYLQSKSPNCMFLYSSSLSVYGDRVNSPDIYVTDKVKVSPGDLYGETKLEAEEIVKNSGLRWTVFRLAAIMKNHKISKLMFNMPLETKFEICTPEDTARAFVNALDKFESVKHKIFNLGGGKACCTTYRNFLENSFRIYGLGKLNFPKYAFAEHNYHCGYFADGDDLNNLLHFRNDTLETYYKRTQAGVSTIIKWLTFILSPIIKWYLLAQSEPYKAYKMQNIEQLKHFFKSESVIKILKKKKIAWTLGIFIMLIIINISNTKVNYKKDQKFEENMYSNAQIFRT
ncbi:MAG: NAD(P)-dependent oxidoreductase [Bacteroidia bacterium]|nr:NAD(P)-dependent oxidoreductase [Bacteroidia bacterium]